MQNSRVHRNDWTEWIHCRFAQLVVGLHLQDQPGNAVEDFRVVGIAVYSAVVLEINGKKCLWHSSAPHSSWLTTNPGQPRPKSNRGALSQCRSGSCRPPPSSSGRPSAPTRQASSIALAVRSKSSVLRRTSVRSRARRHLPRTQTPSGRSSWQVCLLRRRLRPHRPTCPAAERFDCQIGLHASFARLPKAGQARPAAKRLLKGCE